MSKRRSSNNKTSSTIYSGDLINGVPVITKLHVKDLEEGKIHRFMFKAAEMNIGQSWYVPVMVAKGKSGGERLLLITGIHGDELNGTRVMQTVFEKLDPAILSGTVIGVVQASPNALLHISRNWHLSTDGGKSENMNRLFPGKVTGNTAEIQAYKLWNDLWSGNADYVIDMHSQSTDTEYGLFIYADAHIKQAQQLAKLFPADHIIFDNGDNGTVENTFGDADIPAITLEIGGGRQFQPEYVDRAVEGIHNVMVDLNMLEGEVQRTAKDYGTYIGDETDSVYAEVGGYAEVLVEIGDKVSKGQVIALQRNPFGDITKKYEAPMKGHVVSVGTGATREAGGLLVRILS